MTRLSELKTGEQVAAEDAQIRKSRRSRRDLGGQPARDPGHPVPGGERADADGARPPARDKQPAVARLEAGDHEPSMATLARLANRMGITLRLDVEPESVVLVSA